MKIEGEERKKKKGELEAKEERENVETFSGKI